MNSNNRKSSFYYNMRRFHNWIKRSLINLYAYNAEHLLDLASGKGGDIQKWHDAHVKNVVGYDFNEESIQEAQRRLSESNFQDINVQFHVKNLATDVVLPLPNPSNVVTCMFAFHYFFQSQKTFDVIIKSILNNLQINGFFVCCLFDGDLIMEKILSKHFLSDNFHLTLHHKSMSPFGSRVGVYLKDTVLHEVTDEYIVYKNDLVNLMAQNNLELVETRLFSQCYARWQHEFHRNSLNKFEKEVSFLNRYYIFRRTK